MSSFVFQISYFLVSARLSTLDSRLLAITFYFLAIIQRASSSSPCGWSCGFGLLSLLPFYLSLLSPSRSLSLSLPRSLSSLDLLSVVHFLLSSNLSSLLVWVSISSCFIPLTRHRLLNLVSGKFTMNSVLIRNQIRVEFSRKMRARVLIRVRLWFPLQIGISEKFESGSLAGAWIQTADHPSGPDPCADTRPVADRSRLPGRRPRGGVRGEVKRRKRQRQILRRK